MPRSKERDRDVWIKFFPSDWRGDESLQLCSLAARGLWFEMMCLAFKAGGFVLINSSAPDIITLARSVRSTPAETKRLVDELLRNGVASKTPDGVLFSRRMVRDAKRRETNRQNGLNGGNPNLTKSDNRTDNREGPESVKTQKLEARSQIPEPEPEKTQTSAFERFWLLYPRKVGKQAADREWGRQNPDGRIDGQILAGLERALRSRVWQRAMAEPEMPHIPHARTWLHQQRWEDQPSAAQTSAERARVPPNVVQLCEAAGLTTRDTWTWFGDSELVPSDDGAAALVVPDPDHRAWIQRHFAESLGPAAERAGFQTFAITARRPQ